MSKTRVYLDRSTVVNRVLKSLTEGPKTYYQLTQIEKVASRQTVLNALEAAVKDRLILEEGAGPRGKKPYSISRKGQMYLLLKAGLPEREQIEILMNLGGELLIRLEKAGVDTDHLILEMIGRMKPRFNMDYWDDDYYESELSHMINDFTTNILNPDKLSVNLSDEEKHQFLAEYLPDAIKILRIELKNCQRIVKDKRIQLKALENLCNKFKRVAENQAINLIGSA